ncbi:hypothetical protein SUSAZ_08975 [Sulfolobus acidocaldarius SUSAZ]|nr:hypothetical protein SUSAZ_08975 [Sulfolobus acidocaldarius SUSAZ]
MSSQRTCLIYVAGDVTNYSVVDYKFKGTSYRTFFSAHALWQALNPREVIALSPDSLIVTEDCGSPDENVEATKRA